MNKRNYNKEMQDEISSIGCRKPSMLLQCCCAPCATAVINRLKDFDVTLFYYNPNTFPESEYQKRFETLIEYVDKAKLGLNIVEIGYRDEKITLRRSRAFPTRRKAARAAPSA